MSDASASREIGRPTLHHFGLTTANLEAMLDWYGKVLGMTFQSPARPSHWGQEGPTGVRVAWVSNDEANHRIAIVELRRPGGRPGTHPPPATPACRIRIPDRRRPAGHLRPLEGPGDRTCSSRRTTARRPASTTKTPTCNSVELLADNFGDWKKSTEYLRTSSAFAANPLGALRSTPTR